MTKRIDPDLFARLMKMSSETRRDLLEFLGQSPVDAQFLVPNQGETAQAPGKDMSPNDQ